MSNHQPLDPHRDPTTAEMRTFIDTAYWILGSFSFYWQTLVLICITRNQRVELPLLGECSQGEVLIFTLSFFWPVLFALHGVAHAHQSQPQELITVPTSSRSARLSARLNSFFARFPGALGEMRVPLSLAFLRIFLFIVLVAFPTGLQVYFLERTVSRMKVIGTSEPQWAEEHATKVVSGAEIFRWFTLPLDSKNQAVTWMWYHDRDSGTFTYPVKPIGQRGEMVKPAEHMVSAMRIQPWWFAISTIGLSLSLFFLGWRGWRTSRLKPRGKT